MEEKRRAQDSSKQTLGDKQELNLDSPCLSSTDMRTSHTELLPLVDLPCLVYI